LVIEVSIARCAEIQNVPQDIYEDSQRLRHVAQLRLDASSQDRLRDLILDAYKEQESQMASENEQVKEASK